MDKHETAEMLASITYRPGWTFTASAVEPWECIIRTGELGDVVFTMECETVDTDRQYAMEGYPQTKTLDWSLPVDSAIFKDRDDLLRSVFEMLMSIELHESREFFRVGTEDMQAPFHPHREEGNQRWEMTK